VAVRDETGRNRYVAFRPPQPPPSRHELNRNLGDRSWRLTVYDNDDVAILRVPHEDAARAREAIEAEGGVPVTTSGTIKKAKQRAAGVQK
jgi:RNase P/RNase MRP subunit POP5